jgi:prepilin-type N-terminal cleavage/methylation domain-containing protein/prepilin-type processing-associated H-X9-DG protein
MQMVWKNRRITGEARRIRSGFTLVELLVVIGIIAVLLGMLMPALALARAHSRATKCMANLRSIGQACIEYANENHQYIIPSYTLPQYTYTVDGIVDGWPDILDRDGYLVAGAQQSENTAFYCPDTFDINGMGLGQSGTMTNGNQGWLDWPYFTPGPGDSSAKTGCTDPPTGFDNIIRCGYWINAGNPLGSAPSTTFLTTDYYFTTSVGYGQAPGSSALPGTGTGFLRQHKMTDLIRSSDVVAFADGLYAGRQSSSRQVYSQIANPLTGFTSRIAYRHPGIGGSNTASNVCFADGHVERFGVTNFPVPINTTTYTHDQNSALVNGPTIYGNPTGILPY